MTYAIARALRTVSLFLLATACACTDEATAWHVANSGFAPLTDVAWGAQFVAVGPRGTVQSSPDGMSWVPRAQGLVSANLSRVVWSGSQFLVAGDLGTVLSSQDGNNWTASTVQPASNVRSLIWSATQKLFIMALANNQIVTSPDGLSWTVRATDSTSSLAGVSCTDKLCIAVGTSGYLPQYRNARSALAPFTGHHETPAAQPTTGWVATSIDGITWQAASSPSPLIPLGGGFSDVTASPKQIAAIEVSPVKPSLVSSADGNTWTNNALSLSENRIQWTGTQFIVSGSNGGVMTSPDGIGWTSCQSEPGLSIVGFAQAGAQNFFVAIVEGGNYAGLFSVAQLTENCGTWTSRGLGYSFTNVAWVGAEYVALGAFGRLMTSPDGKVWTAQNSGTSANLFSAAASDDTLIAVGGKDYGDVLTSSTIISSSDGKTWNRVAGTTMPMGSLYSVAWSGQNFVAVGPSGIATSFDGKSWLGQSAPAGLLAVTWSGHIFAAVGINGNAAASFDGITWASAKTGSDADLTGIASSGSIFVAVGTGGIIVESSDGVHWSTRGSGTQNDLSNVTWTGGQFIAVGSGGVILMSPDGRTWKLTSSGTTLDLTGVGAGPTDAVAVGLYGVSVRGQ